MKGWISTPESSNVAGFDYDEERNVLVVEFNRGGCYEYYDVDERLYEGMKVAPSKGGFLHSHIKGRFRYARQ